MQNGRRTTRELRRKTSLFLVVIFGLATLWTYPRLVTNAWCLVHDHVEVHHADADSHDDDHHGDDNESDCLQIVSYWHSSTGKDAEIKIEAPPFAVKTFEQIEYLSQKTVFQKHPQIFRYVTEQTLHFIETIVLIV